MDRAADYSVPYLTKLPQDHVFWENLDPTTIPSEAHRPVVADMLEIIGTPLSAKDKENLMLRATRMYNIHGKHTVCACCGVRDIRSSTSSHEVYSATTGLVSQFLSLDASELTIFNNLGDYKCISSVWSHPGNIDYHVFLHPEFVFWSNKESDFMATICQHCVAYMISKKQAPPFSAKKIDFRDWHRYPGYVELSDVEMLVVSPFRTYGLNFMISPSSLEADTYTGHAICLFQDGLTDVFDKIKSWQDLLASVPTVVGIVFLGIHAHFESLKTIKVFECSKSKIVNHVKMVKATMPGSYLDHFYDQLGDIRVVDEGLFADITKAILNGAVNSNNEALMAKSATMLGGVEHATEQGINLGKLPTHVDCNMSFAYFACVDRDGFQKVATSDDEIVTELLDALQEFVSSAKEVASSSGIAAVIDHDGDVIIEGGGGGGERHRKVYFAISQKLRVSQC